MNECQHTDEHMNGYEKAINDNIDDKTANQKEGGGGGQKQTQNKETQER